MNALIESPAQTAPTSRFTVPWNLSEWTTKAQLLAWVQEELGALHWDNPELVARLRRQRNFAYVRRQVPPETAARVAGLAFGAVEAMARLDDRLEEQDIRLSLSPEAREKIADEGYDPAYGARPLKRVIQRAVGDRLATTILEGRAGDGDTITVDVGHSEGGEPAALQISVNGASEATPSK